MPFSEVRSETSMQDFLPWTITYIMLFPVTSLPLISPVISADLAISHKLTALEEEFH